MLHNHKDATCSLLLISQLPKTFTYVLHCTTNLQNLTQASIPPNFQNSSSRNSHIQTLYLTFHHYLSNNQVSTQFVSMAFPSLYLNVSNACHSSSLKIKDKHKFAIDSLMPPKSTIIGSLVSQTKPTKNSTSGWVDPKITHGCP